MMDAEEVRGIGDLGLGLELGLGLGLWLGLQLGLELGLELGLGLGLGLRGYEKKKKKKKGRAGVQQFEKQGHRNQLNPKRKP